MRIINLKLLLHHSPRALRNQTVYKISSLVCLIIFLKKLISFGHHHMCNNYLTHRLCQDSQILLLYQQDYQKGREQIDKLDSFSHHECRGQEMASIFGDFCGHYGCLWVGYGYCLGIPCPTLTQKILSKQPPIKK